MKPTFWFRAAAILSLIFAAGHTAGFLLFQAPSEQGRAVWSRMQSVTFFVDGRAFSYGKFYTGFGLFISGFELFLAFLCWWLSNVSCGETEHETFASLRPLLWALILVEAMSMLLSILYFSVGPTVVSALVGISLVMAALRSPLKAGLGGQA